MSTADQLDNLSNSHQKMRKFEEASSLDKARAAEFRTKLRRAQRTRKHSKVRKKPIITPNSLPAGPEPRRGRKRLVAEEHVTVILCAIKDGKLVHNEDFHVGAMDFPDCCRHIFTHGGACEHLTPAGPEHLEIVKQI
jgi:hypothetical protein